MVGVGIGADDDPYPHGIAQHILEDGGNHPTIARFNRLAEHGRRDTHHRDVGIEVDQFGTAEPCIVFTAWQLEFQRTEHTIPCFGQIHGLLHAHQAFGD